MVKGPVLWDFEWEFLTLIWLNNQEGVGKSKFPCGLILPFSYGISNSMGEICFKQTLFYFLLLLMLVNPPNL